MVFDIDGDGTSELIIRDTERHQSYALRPGSPAAGHPLTWQPVVFPVVGKSAYGARLTPGDFNGDGLADTAYMDGTTLTVWINTGNHEFISRNFPHPAVRPPASLRTQVDRSEMALSQGLVER